MLLKKLFTTEPSHPFIMVGLGNPGRGYEFTRHNVGFLVIDRLAEKWGITLRKVKFRSLVGDCFYNESKVILIKPQTFMNHSGDAVTNFIRFYKAPLENLLVVFDDLDLPFGSLRFRASGGSSGHKGMQSIINYLGQDGFPRLRIGVGRPPGKIDPSDFILTPFNKSEMEMLEIILFTATEAIEMFIRHGLEKSMTEYNRSLLNDDGKSDY